MIIILHKGKIWENLLFESKQQARNKLKMSFIGRGGGWKEPIPDCLINNAHGSKFEIIELKLYTHENNHH
jgi:hypothetical protein